MRLSYHLQLCKTILNTHYDLIFTEFRKWFHRVYKTAFFKDGANDDDDRDDDNDEKNNDANGISSYNNDGVYYDTDSRFLRYETKQNPE